MKTRLNFAAILLLPAIAVAQVPVDKDGNVIGDYEPESSAVAYTHEDLQDLVGPIALYPDDLLAIVLPASAYPLQVVEAARFLDAYDQDSSLEPSPDWDESVVALTNYPEVVDLLNDDLDWTLRLGEAVVERQTDVIAAIETFRDRAYAAGNLQSDEYQTVAEDDGVIVISPVEEDVIYVPYYEPERVVYYQPQPVYYYYPRPRPVYYYPYSAGHHFNHGYFWGVTTAFSIGWFSDSLHTHHHSYYGHPYYGRTYWNHWYRRPSISVYNTYYNYNSHGSNNYNSNGNRWNAHERRREYVRREGYNRDERRIRQRSGGRSDNVVHRQPAQPAITFRERDTRVADRRDSVADRGQTNRRSTTDRSDTTRTNSRRPNKDRSVTHVPPTPARTTQTNRRPDKSKREVQHVPPTLDSASTSRRQTPTSSTSRRTQRLETTARDSERRTSERRSTTARAVPQTRRAPAAQAPQQRAPVTQAPQRRAPQQRAPQQRSQPQQRAPQQRSQPQPQRSQPAARSEPPRESKSSSRSSSRRSESKPRENRR